MRHTVIIASAAVLAVGFAVGRITTSDDAAVGWIAAAVLSVVMAVVLAPLARRIWRRTGEIRAEWPEAASARRSMLGIGVVGGLLLGPIGVFLGARSAENSVAALVFLGLTALTVLTTSLVVLALASSPITRDDDRRPADSAPRTDGEWLRWEHRGAVLRLAALGPFAGVLVTLPLQASTIFADGEGGSIVFPVFVIGAGIGLVVWLVLRRAPTPWIDPRARTVRAGARSAPWHEFTSATLHVGAVLPGLGRTLMLTLHTDAGLRLPIVLRRDGRLALSDADTELAERIVAASEVRMPRAKEDPEGRFSRFNFPQNVDKDAALELVRHPPAEREPLPIPG